MQLVMLVHCALLAASGSPPDLGAAPGEWRYVANDLLGVEATSVSAPATTDRAMHRVVGRSVPPSNLRRGRTLKGPVRGMGLGLWRRR